MSGTTRMLLPLLLRMIRSPGFIINPAQVLVVPHLLHLSTAPHDGQVAVVFPLDHKTDLWMGWTEWIASHNDVARFDLSG